MHKAAGSGVSMTFDQTQISKIKVIFHIVTKADGSPDSKDFILNWCFWSKYSQTWEGKRNVKMNSKTWYKMGL